MWELTEGPHWSPESKRDGLTGETGETVPGSTELWGLSRRNIAKVLRKNKPVLRNSSDVL